jgi:hypothetical protein
MPLPTLLGRHNLMVKTWQQGQLASLKRYQNVATWAGMLLCVMS